mgnify:CR=1 FL=1
MHDGVAFIVDVVDLCSESEEVGYREHGFRFGGGFVSFRTSGDPSGGKERRAALLVR